MTIIRDDLFAITGARFDGTLNVRSKILRPGTVYDGAITPWLVTVAITDGKFTTPDLDPGPAEIEIISSSWADLWPNVSIPDSAEPLSLTAVLEMYSEYEPGVISEAWQAATAARAAADEAELSAQGVDAAVAGLSAARDEAVAAAATATGAADAAAADAVDAVLAQVVQVSGDALVGAETAASAAAVDRQAAGAYANNASNSATAADGSALTAAGHASTASGAKDTATFQAGAATAQAGVATTQAGIAEDAAVAAEGHATDAAGSAAAAAASEQQAELWKIAAEEAAGQSQSGAPAGGWPRTDLAQDVRTSLTLADGAATQASVDQAITAHDTGVAQPRTDALWDALANDPNYAVTTDDKIAARAKTVDVNSDLAGKAPLSHTHTIGNVTGLQTALDAKASTTAMHARPAMFSGGGPPPGSIPGAVVGDHWLDTSSMELHKITGV